MYPCTETTDSKPHCTCKNTTNGTHDKRFRHVFCTYRLQRSEKGRAHQAMTPQGIIQDTVASRVKILFKKSAMYQDLR